MTWVAVAVVGGSIIGGLINKSASDRASDAQSEAARRANETQLAMYNQNRADTEPWRKAGGGAVGQMSMLTGPGGEFNRSFSMADYQQDPGYAFRLSEGQKALERSASARGNLLGGAGLRAIDRYGQDYASNEYQNAYNRWQQQRTQQFNQLASLAGLGQTSTGQLGQAGSNTANQIGGNMMNLGAGESARALAQGNNWSGAINNGVNNWLNYKYMNNNNNDNWGGGGGGAGDNYQDWGE